VTSTLSTPAVDDHDVDRELDRAASERPPVEVFGIRHHGPGSARSLVAALIDYQPDVVLIEGPADADPLLRWVLADGMTPHLRCWATPRIVLRQQRSGRTRSSLRSGKP
jgi:hypothetical protein